MKKYIRFIIVLLATSLVMVACDKDWLDPAPENQLITSDSTFNDPANATRFVNAGYANLLTWEQSAFSWMGMASITSDNADKGSDPGDLGADKDQMDALTYTPTTISVTEVWKGNFQGISNCNQALANVPKFDIPQDLKDRLMAEAKFLRAYYYFNLVRTFGAVPLLDKVVDSEDPADLNKANTRVPSDEVYAFIEQTLTEAIAVLPLSYPASELGRATKGAAIGLLAKVSMYQKKWEEAFNLTNQIINGEVGNYGLLADYDSIWREEGENSIESLFEVQSRAGLPIAAVQQLSGVRHATELQTTTRCCFLPLHARWSHSRPKDRSFPPRRL